MIWRVELSDSAQKFLKRIPAKDEARIRAGFLEMMHNPYAGDVWKLRGEGVWRRRIGSYRVFFEIYELTRNVRVYGVERRGSHTY
jgi:mRNA-degrading endonuclease RelE of RelBE toxin-antitoxin system